jgi:hypothetical protein
MSDPLDGKVEVLTQPAPAGVVTIVLDGTKGDLIVGGNGQGGNVRVKNAAGDKTLIEVGTGIVFAVPSQPPGKVGDSAPAPSLGSGILIANGAGESRITLESTGQVEIGNHGASGRIFVKTDDGSTAVAIRSSGSGEGITVSDSTGAQRISLHGNAAETIRVRDKAGRVVLTVVPDAFDDKTAGMWFGTPKGGRSKPAKAALVVLRGVKGSDAIILNGGVGENVLVNDAAGKRVLNFVGDAFDNQTAALWLGTHTADNGKKPALVILRGWKGNDAIVLNGGKGENIFIRDAKDRPVFNFAGDAFDEKIAGLWLGAGKEEGKKPGLVVIRNAKGDDAIVLDGTQGDIIFSNADLAEDFESVEADAEPGTVMVIDNDGRLRPCDQPYDRRVAGVVSGAGGVRPAIVLGHEPGHESRHPVALTGKAMCRADARAIPIEVGDLLTTSSTIGHAMAARDPQRAFGAVIGKAMAPLSGGRGFVPILVSLQ